MVCSFCRCNDASGKAHNVRTCKKLTDAITLIDGAKVALMTLDGVKDHLLACCADFIFTAGVTTAATFIYSCYDKIKKVNALKKFHQLPRSKQAAAMAKFFDGEDVMDVITELL